MNAEQLTLFQSMASRYGTPSYVFDTKELTARVSLIREKLPKDTRLCFAMKANPFLTATMAGLTDRLEVCSPGEYEICIRENIPPEQIVVSGVNKTVESMERIFSYSQGAGIYTIESPLHYQILKQYANRTGRRLQVLLRLSGGNQFGMDEDTLMEVLAAIQKDNALYVTGIHYYGGTQKTFKKMQHELQVLSALGEKLQREYGLNNLELEYGPGLPVTYFESERTGDVDRAKESRTSLNSVEQQRADSLLSDDRKLLSDLCSLLDNMTAYPHICIELGRFLAATCGYYMTRIMDMKHTGDTNFLIVDGGIHQLSYYGQMLGMKRPYLHILNMPAENGKITLQKTQAQQNKTWTICGSLCTANDILVRQAGLEMVQMGDILIFERCGAYSVTEGMAMFLSRELPQVLLIHEDESIEILRNKLETNIFHTRMEDEHGHIN